MAGFIGRREAGNDGRYLQSIQPDDSEDRPELNHHREHGVFVSEQLAEKEEVRRGRDGKKFGDSLHDSKQRRG
jgi:hypothetical protein